MGLFESNLLGLNPGQRQLVFIGGLARGIRQRLPSFPDNSRFAALEYIVDKANRTKDYSRRGVLVVPVEQTTLDGGPAYKFHAYDDEWTLTPEMAAAFEPMGEDIHPSSSIPHLSVAVPYSGLESVLKRGFVLLEYSGADRINAGEFKDYTGVEVRPHVTRSISLPGGATLKQSRDADLSVIAYANGEYTVIDHRGHGRWVRYELVGGTREEQDDAGSDTGLEIYREREVESSGSGFEVVDFGEEVDDEDPNVGGQEDDPRALDPYESEEDDDDGLPHGYSTVTSFDGFDQDIPSLEDDVGLGEFEIPQAEIPSPPALQPLSQPTLEERQQEGPKPRYTPVQQQTIDAFVALCGDEPARTRLVRTMSNQIVENLGQRGQYGSVYEALEAILANMAGSSEIRRRGIIVSGRFEKKVKPNRKVRGDTVRDLYSFRFFGRRRTIRVNVSPEDDKRTVDMVVRVSLDGLVMEIPSLGCSRAYFLNGRYFDYSSKVEGAYVDNCLGVEVRPVQRDQMVVLPKLGQKRLDTKDPLVVVAYNRGEVQVYNLEGKRVKISGTVEEAIESRMGKKIRAAQATSSTFDSEEYIVGVNDHLTTRWYADASAFQDDGRTIVVQGSLTKPIKGGVFQFQHYDKNGKKKKRFTVGGENRPIRAEFFGNVVLFYDGDNIVNAAQTDHIGYEAQAIRTMGDLETITLKQVDTSADRIFHRRRGNRYEFRGEDLREIAGDSTVALLSYCRPNRYDRFQLAYKNNGELVVQPISPRTITDI